MKAGLTGKRKSRGSATIEVVIAFAVMSLTMTAAIVITFGTQAVALETILNHEALTKTSEELEAAFANGQQTFSKLVSIAPANDGMYVKSITVDDLTRCLKKVTSLFTWQATPVRPQQVLLTTEISDRFGVLANGTDCEAAPPLHDWIVPLSLGHTTFTPGVATGLDVLNGIVYMSSNKSPGVRIADARHPGSPTLFTYANGFDLGSDGVNAIDAAKNINGKLYAYLAHNAATDQLQVIDVSDPENPAFVTARSLPGVAGAKPEGWSVYYYDSRLYIGTRRTVGREFHVFDVTDPTNPIWLGSRELNHNVNAIIVRDKIAYLATSGNVTDLIVLDVSDPSTGMPTIKNLDLSGNHDGKSLYLLGMKLYFGKLTGSGPDFYVLDVSDPGHSIPLLAKLDLGTGALGIRVVGHLAFVITSNPSNPFLVWDISDSSHPTRVNPVRFAVTQTATGIDYEDELVYISNQTNDALRIVYSP